MTLFLHYIFRVLFYLLAGWGYLHFREICLNILQPQAYTIPTHAYIFLQAILSNAFVTWAVVAYCVYKSWGAVLELKEKKKFGIF